MKAGCKMVDLGGVPFLDIYHTSIFAMSENIPLTLDGIDLYPVFVG